MTDKGAPYFYLNKTLSAGRLIHLAVLASMTERHALEIPLQDLTPIDNVMGTIHSERAVGVVIALPGGMVPRPVLALADVLLGEGKEVWFYFPKEKGIEKIDDLRLATYQRYRKIGAIFITTLSFRATVVSGAKGLFRRLWRMIPWRNKIAQAILNLCNKAQRRISRSDLRDNVGVNTERANIFASEARPVPMRGLHKSDDTGLYVAGRGMYLRLDYWAKIVSGGSYGHTCYVAKELMRSSSDMTCVMANHFPLLDDMGVRQVVHGDLGLDQCEESIVQAHDGHYDSVKMAATILRPDYVYERICIGDYVGAKVCLELGIPYFVEYNGSEISMKRSFDDAPYQFEEYFYAAEDAAFAAATVISVVSSVVRDQLVERGVDSQKILVNPNGVDVEDYAPVGEDEKRALRAEIGLPDSGPVIGFIATFGGWHGIDILAEAIPRILKGAPTAHFLIIGDGNFRHLVDEAVDKSGAAERVVMTGRLPQKESARLMKACDIFLSPHSAHMIDSRFFGSPTKVFEYMALQGGIVASDLEQIGEVLAPALRVAELRETTPDIGDRRSILCEPGDVDEFVEAVIALAERPDLARALGENSRKAAIEHYSWERHVQKLWEFAAKMGEGRS